MKSVLDGVRFHKKYMFDLRFFLNQQARRCWSKGVEIMSLIGFHQVLVQIHKIDAYKVCQSRMNGF